MMRAFHLKTWLTMTLALLILSCAAGLKGRKEEQLAYFDHLEQDTLALLIKEHPQSEQELADAAGYTIAEKKTVKVPFVGVGDGIGLVREKASDRRSYLQFTQLQFGFGLGVRANRIVVIFQDLNKLREAAAGRWHVGIAAEATAKVGDVGAAGEGGKSDLTEKGYSTYVLTDCCVSASATIRVLRARPYSVE
ncbi:putative Lipoprotein [Nitrospira japonica]|uniref:Putative Lipoprotein n=1 Tax=Nitrospira japonica TaxID=1325564 RepID=A0A1W1I1F0_9BACT|nr:hypothetical protein [Nitrospira japonica]SLM46817.1 putative Lipoprotein [Nitrospira japonica]